MRTNPVSPPNSVRHPHVPIRLWSAVVCALALALTACGSSEKKAAPSGKTSEASSAPTSNPRPGDQDIAVKWQGKQRLYRVHAPPSYRPGKKVPLVIALHPFPSDGTYVRALSGLSDKADEEGFLVAYPDGLDQAYNALVCCGSEDDVGFIRSMVEHLTKSWGADPDRVYATGISNGGDMTFKLAVELSDTIAATAPVSGGFIGTAPQKDDYRPTSPVSVITFIGGQDRNYDDFDAGIALWQKRLGCKATAPGKPSGAGKPPGEPAGKITRTEATCADGSDVVTYRLEAMGHSWPGGRTGEMADPEAGVDATDVMWEFFASHPKAT